MNIVLQVIYRFWFCILAPAFFVAVDRISVLLMKNLRGILEYGHFRDFNLALMSEYQSLGGEFVAGSLSRTCPSSESLRVL